MSWYRFINLENKLISLSAISIHIFMGSYLTAPRSSHISLLLLRVLFNVHSYVGCIFLLD